MNDFTDIINTLKQHLKPTVNYDEVIKTDNIKNIPNESNPNSESVTNFNQESESSESESSESESNHIELNEQSNIISNQIDEQNEQNEQMIDYNIPEFLLNEDVIGIDLGTTNTCVAIWKDNCAEIIPDEFGNKLIPSYVAYTNINRYVGLDAKNQKDINIKNVFYEVKRLIGRKINDDFVKKEQKLLTYDIVSDENKNILLKPHIKDNRLITPEEILLMVLLKAKQNAQNYLKKK